MDTSEFLKPSSEVVTLEGSIQPKEFLALVLEYLDTDYRDEVEDINGMIQTDPKFQEEQSPNKSFTETITQAAQQIKLDLPNILKATEDALAGKKVKLIVRPKGSYFYTGELLDQDDRPKETTGERNFRGHEKELVDVLKQTLENRPRQDLGIISGFSELLGLDNIKNAALKAAKSMAEIESQAGLVWSGKPIKLSTLQGKTRLIGKPA